MVTSQRVKYADINNRQKEIFNFQKVSTLRPNFVFPTYRLTDYLNGADFISVHFDSIHITSCPTERTAFLREEIPEQRSVAALPSWWPTLPLSKRYTAVRSFEAQKYGYTNSWAYGGYSFPVLIKSQELYDCFLGHGSSFESELTSNLLCFICCDLCDLRFPMYLSLLTNF